MSYKFLDKIFMIVVVLLWGLGNLVVCFVKSDCIKKDLIVIFLFVWEGFMKGFWLLNIFDFIY